MSQDNLIGFACTTCKKVNYYSVRNKKRVPDKIKPSKYCKHCRAKKDHKEVKV